MEDGYVVSHDLKLSFDFDTDRLSKVLTAISICPAGPTMHIRFTIKDTTAVSEEMLRSAAENAKRKAEIDFTPDDIDVSDTAAFVWEIC